MEYSSLIGSPPMLRLPRPGIVKRNIRAKRVPEQPERVKPLLAVLDAFRLKPVEPVHVLEGSFRNETWTVMTNAGKKVLKRYKTNLKYETILHEHSILQHLEDLGFPSTRLVEDRTGETIVTHEGRFYGLQEFLEGYAPFGGYFYFPSRTEWFITTAGRALGRLHQALRDFLPSGSPHSGFRTDGGRFYDLDWYQARLAEVRADTPGSKAAVHPVIQTVFDRADWIEHELRAADSAVQAANIKRSLVHGDYGPYNLMVRWGDPLVVLDFELSRTDYRLVDLISFLSSGASKGNVLNTNYARLFLNGYQAENPLPEEELRVLPLVWRFQMLRYIIAAWHSFLKDPRPILLEDIRKRIERLDWLEKNPSID